MASRPWLAVLASVAPLAFGCVVVDTGALEFSEDFDVEDVRAVRLELPSTPIPVEGCDPDLCDQLEISGRWLAVGVTKSKARDLAGDASFDFDVQDGFARLVAVRPIDVQDLLDLEVEAVELPWDRELEVETSVGDVAVETWTGSVNIQVDAGNIDVKGGDGGVYGRTGRGRIRVETGGNADLATDAGDVELSQTESLDAYVSTEIGDVLVELNSDENVDLVIEARGRIEVETDQIRTITSGSFSRQTGDGSRKVQIFTDLGDVEVVMTSGREER